MKSKILGFLDSVTETTINGWVKYEDNETPCEIDLVLDNTVVDTQIANRYRPDLQAKKIHETGNCGFRFHISPDLIKQVNSIRVVAKHTRKDIRNSPFKLIQSFSSVNDNDAEPLIFFVHIPKTAGTSFRMMLSKLYEDKEMYPNKKILKERNGQYPMLHNIEPTDLNEKKIFYGHYPFILGNLIERPKKYITFLREPISRTISNIYHYYHYDPILRGQDLETIFDKRIPLFNNQVRFLADTILSERLQFFDSPKFPPVALKTAKENLMKCDFIGLTERFDESIELLKKVFNFNFEAIEIHNKGVKKGNPPISPQLREKIITANQLDLELYEFAKTLFEEKMEIYSND